MFYCGCCSTAGKALRQVMLTVPCPARTMEEARALLHKFESRLCAASAITVMASGQVAAFELAPGKVMELPAKGGRLAHTYCLLFGAPDFQQKSFRAPSGSFVTRTPYVSQQRRPPS
jgi:predicted aconitase